MSEHIAVLEELLAEERRHEGKGYPLVEARIAAYGAAIALMRGQSDMVLVPRRLTAENGAKAALIGEVQIRDHARGMWVDVSWTAIKELHRKMVAHFHPQQEPAE